MFGTKESITVRIKLFSGLDRQVIIDNYDPDAGIDLQIVKGARLKKIFKTIGLSRNESAVCFINGKKVDLNEKLNNGDVLFIMKPVSGG
jgi:molybdopterin converting factor small subunit